MPYLARRLLQVVPVLFGVLVLTFALVHAIPGDPARVVLGPRAPESAVAALHAQWGLDQPLLVQFGRFMSRVVRGDLGMSQFEQHPVASLIARRFPATLLLVVYATVLSIALSVPLAMWAASRRGGVADNAIRVVPLIGLGMPVVWLGIVLIQAFSIRLGWFPVSGGGQGVAGRLHAMFLPSLSLAIAISPILIRGLRESLISVIESDYMATARSKGLSGWRVLIRHGLRNALIPVVTLIGLNIAFLMGGAVVIETIFSVPGIGDLMIDGVLRRDFPVVQGVTLFVTLLVIVVSVVTDLVHARLEPRMRLS